MKEKNTIPEPEIFTAEIEDTIDDLFKPSKKIEIDPLTQEIKEVQAEPEGAQESPLELDLKVEEQGPPPVEVEAEAAPVEDEKQETLLELDLELELEEQQGQGADQAEPQKQPESAAGQAPKAPDEPQDIGKRLEQLNQQLFTIEWEVTETQIHQTLDLLAELLAAPEVNAQARTHSIIELMKRVLQNMQFHPETVPATAPSVLKKSTSHLTDILTGKDVQEEDTEDILLELKALIEKPEETVTEAEPLFLDQEALMEDQGDKKTEEESRLEEPGPQGPAPEKESLHGPAPVFPAEEGLRVLEAHLIELNRCVNRIEPLEKLLSKTHGMEKLYRFQHDIRRTLEDQILELSNCFFKGRELELPKPSRSEKDSQDYINSISDKTGASCPWKELLTVNIEGMEIGFPNDQLVYASAPPWLSKSAIRKGESLTLARLKAWPWSKLKGLFKGALAGMDDSVLSAMSFPVIRRLGDQELKVPSSFTVIILYDGENGAALLTGEPPLPIKIPEDAEYTPEMGGGFEGQVNTNGNIIKVATASSLNQV